MNDHSPIVVTGGFPPEICDMFQCNSGVNQDNGNISVTEHQAELLVQMSDIEWCEKCYPDRANGDTDE